MLLLTRSHWGACSRGEAREMACARRFLRGAVSYIASACAPLCPAPPKLMQVDANDVVGFKFVCDCTVTDASDHRCKFVALFHEVFRADQIEKAFADGDIGEFDAATRGRCHVKLTSKFKREEFTRDVLAGATLK